MDARNGASPRPWGSALASLLCRVALRRRRGGDGNGSGVAPAGPNAASPARQFGAARRQRRRGQRARVEVPASALAADTTIRIARRTAVARRRRRGRDRGVAVTRYPWFELRGTGQGRLSFSNRTLAEGSNGCSSRPALAAPVGAGRRAVVADGNISAAVSSFSYFAAGIISIRQSTATPFSPTFQFECPNRSTRCASRAASARHGGRVWRGARARGHELNAGPARGLQTRRPRV